MTAKLNKYPEYCFVKQLNALYKGIFFAIITFVFGVELVFSANEKKQPGGKFTIVIDAGHGGHDPGCHGIKYKEKDVALAIALKLGKLIEQNCEDVKVVYTRKTDVFLELNERAKIANDNKADLFLCIHCNASPNKKVFGSETYAMGLHKSKGNLEVAKRENAAILLEEDYKKNYENFDPNSDEANIIFSMYQNLYLEKSLKLASYIQEYYQSKSCRVDKGVKQAGFLVLWKTSMPSLLTETGFLTNPEEEKFLGSKEGQEYMALSLFLAFRKYKDEINGIKKSYNDELENRIGCVLKNEEEKPEQDSSSVKLINLPKQEKTIEEEKKAKNETPTEQLVFFSVQILNSNKKLKHNDEKFKNLPDIHEFKRDNEFKYSSGKFFDLKEAVDHQEKVRKMGFSDAFIIGFNGKERISAKEAKLLMEQRVN